MLRKFLAIDGTGWDKSGYIYGRHPDLETRLKGVRNGDDRYQVIHEYVRQYRRNNADDFQAALRRNEALWRPIESEYLQTLSEHFETPYPSRRKIIRAYLSLIPIYPRWLDTWEFNVSYFRPERAREIACHEILHFLWFKKWREVLPETRKEECNSPHLVWRLSEIVDPVILNEHPVFKKYFDHKQQTYQHFQRIRIDGMQPTTYFARLYRTHLRSAAPFADFIHLVDQDGKKHASAIMGA